MWLQQKTRLGPNNTDYISYSSVGQITTLTSLEVAPGLRSLLEGLGEICFLLIQVASRIQLFVCMRLRCPFFSGCKLRAIPKSRDHCVSWLLASCFYLQSWQWWAEHSHHVSLPLLLSHVSLARPEKVLLTKCDRVAIPVYSLHLQVHKLNHTCEVPLWIWLWAPSWAIILPRFKNMFPYLELCVFVNSMMFSKRELFPVKNTIWLHHQMV